jgi:hypothetical protein
LLQSLSATSAISRCRSSTSRSTEDLEIPIDLATSNVEKPAASGHTIRRTVAAPSGESVAQSTVAVVGVETEELRLRPSVDAPAAELPDGAASLPSEEVDVAPAEKAVGVGGKAAATRRVELDGNPPAFAEEEGDRVFVLMGSHVGSAGPEGVVEGFADEPFDDGCVMESPRPA